MLVGPPFDFRFDLDHTNDLTNLGVSTGHPDILPTRFLGNVAMNSFDDARSGSAKLDPIEVDLLAQSPICQAIRIQ